MPFPSGPLQWTQVIDNHAPEGNTFGYNESRTQLYVDVAFVDELQAIEQILGFPSGIDQANQRMTRTLPASHPKFPWHYAARENLRAYQYEAKAVGPDNSSYAGYNYSRIVCDFQPLPYDVLADGQTTFEWQRWVERTAVTTMENIQIPRGTFTFVDGPASPRLFQQGAILRVPKTDVVWIWHQVLDSYLMRDRYATIGNALRACLGCVNQYWFPSLVTGQTDPNTPAANTTGYPPGTLLFLSATPKPWAAPVSPADVGIQDQSRPPRVWSLECRFLLFEPPVAANYGYRGHNLFPTIQTNNGVVEVSNNWYLATSDGTNTGVFRYPSADFNNIFNPAT